MADLTAFGKEVRKLRIDGGVSLMDFADAMGCSASFVSSVDTGRRNPPEEYVNQVVKYFKLDRKRATELHKLAHATRKVVQLRPKAANREVVAEFARKIGVLDTQDIGEIMQILNRREVK